MFLKVAALALLSALALAPAAEAFDRVVSRNGRVGDVQIDRASIAQVRAMEGRRGSASRIVGEGGTSGTQLRFACGSARRSLYVFDARGRLANFQTTCHSWRTANGTRVGDSRDDAEAGEGKTARPFGCGDGEVIVRRGKAKLYVTFFTETGPVRVLAVEGRRSVLGC